MPLREKVFRLLRGKDLCVAFSGVQFHSTWLSTLQTIASIPQDDLASNGESMVSRLSLQLCRDTIIADIEGDRIAG